MSATTIAKWTTKEIKEELQVLIQPEALLKTGRFYQCRSKQLIQFGLRKLTFFAVCKPQDQERLFNAAYKLEQCQGIHQVLIKRMSRLEYYYIQVYVKPEYFQKVR